MPTPETYEALGLAMSTQTISLVDIETIRTAAKRIASIAVKTPLVRAAFAGVSGYGTGREIWLKAENLQPIGAFKMRGAFNKILQLTPEEIARGVITYSSGNHAQAVAYAARDVGAKAVIVMPSNAPAVKRAATLALGAEIVDVGVASSERLAMAENWRASTAMSLFRLTTTSRSSPARLLAAWRLSRSCPTWTWSFRRSRAAACSAASPRP